MNEQYEVSHYFNRSFNSLDRNILSRLRSLFPQGIKEHPLLPKFIVVVLDDDLLQCFKAERSGYIAQKQMEKAIHWLMTEFGRLVEAQQDYLPKRGIRVDYPHFIWIEPPTHNNFRNNALRELFAAALEKETLLFPRVSAVPLKKVWEFNRMSFFLKAENRFSFEGIAAYWEAVDKAVRYADTILIKKLKKKLSHYPTAPTQGKNEHSGHSNHKQNHRHNKYHWSSTSSSERRHRRR